MARLGERGVRLLYLDSLGFRTPGLRRADLSRMGARLLRWRPYAYPTAPNVFRDSPLVVPLHRFSAVRALNRQLLVHRLKRNERRLRLDRPVVWAYSPAGVDAFRRERHRALVYHCVDDVAAYPGIDAATWREGERHLVHAADICIASSKPLVEHLTALGAREVRYWPNPADIRAFRSAGEARDAGAPNSHRPVIGFAGSVQEHKVDVPLVAAIARMKPDWRIVLAGPVGLGLRSSSISADLFPENVELPGLIKRDALPKYIASFDVATIPYALNDYTRGVFPMKVFEYLGAGLPVVSTSLKSLVGEVDHVSFADDPENFVAAVEAALRSGPEERQVRRDYADQFSWERRADQALELLDHLAP